jgi:hypothetical protein
MPSRPESASKPRTVLICHAESRLNLEAIGSWLASIAELAGVVVIEDRPSSKWTRILREVRRIGVFRLLDVIAFRIYYAIFLSRKDAAWLARRLDEHKRRFPCGIGNAAVLRTGDPNSDSVARFIRDLAPDFALARCKHILRKEIFDAPRLGTFVLHPGICPEYRNAHGAFWALAGGDLDRVGLTLLRVDRGVDTGPVYGFYRCNYDETSESHIVIMTKLVLDNLDQIAVRLAEVCEGRATRIDTTGRRSAIWGQPWLTAYMRWKCNAGRRRRAFTGT